jgi:hypothetical protein
MRFQKSQPTGAATLVPPSASTEVVISIKIYYFCNEEIQRIPSLRYVAVRMRLVISI